MEASVIERDLDIHDGVACKYARLHCALNTLIDRLDIFLRYCAADDLVDKLVAFSALVRLNNNLDVTVLSVTARLTRVLHIDVRALAYRFTVGDLRLTDIRFDLKLAKESVDDDFKVKLTHASDNRLACFLVGVGSEGRVLFCQL